MDIQEVLLSWKLLIVTDKSHFYAENLKCYIQNSVYNKNAVFCITYC